MNVLTNLNLSKNELQNAVIHPLAIAPANPKLGQIYCNSADKLIYFYDGEQWSPVGSPYELPIASPTTLGGVQPVAKTSSMTQDVGVGADGKLYVVPPEVQSVPIATKSTRGVIIVGDGLNVNSEGKVDINASVNESTGAVSIDGDTVNVIESITVGGSSVPVSKSGTNVNIDVLPTGGGTMTGAIDMGGSQINNIPNASSNAQPVAYGQLPTTPVVTDFELDYDGDTVTINKDYVNVKTGTTTSDTETIALASGTTAGLMSPSSVQAIQDLTDRVDALEGTTVRLLYATKTNPSQAEIEAFVRAEGYTDPTKWAGIAVVVSGTYHIWHYYASGSVGWRDDGVDTVSQWTNSTLGIIKGSSVDGQVYAEDDGTGSVNGWSALKNRVSNVETNKADATDVAAIPVVKTATGTISTSGTTITVNYSGNVISTFVKDSSGDEVIVDVKINASSVVFTCASNPSSTLTCTVVYI